MSITIENIVASDNIGAEIDLYALSQAAEHHNVEYEPEQHAAVIIRLEPATVLLYRSGSFVITGANDWESLDSTIDLFQKFLSDLGVNFQEFSEVNVVNLAFSGSVNKELDLEICCVELGIENTEYEPEQSPFLIYRPPHFNCVLTVSSTGNIVLTGIVDEKKAQEAFNDFKSKINSHCYTR